MPTPPKKSREPFASPARPLSERVQDRVHTVTTKLASHRRGTQRRDLPTQLGGSNHSPELQALNHVFRDMGRTQRSARRQKGQAASSAVRQAALAFRENPSLPALVLVAASLDEVGLLFW